MPFQDFEGSDDAIVSRLEFDVDDTQVIAMKSITDITDNLKTNLESIARFADSFDDYLKSITTLSTAAEKAQETTIKQLERQEELQGSLLDGQKTLLANFKEIYAAQQGMDEAYQARHSSEALTNLDNPVVKYDPPVGATQPIAVNDPEPSVRDTQPLPAPPAQAPEPTTPPTQERHEPVPTPPATPGDDGVPDQAQHRQTLEDYIQQTASETVKRQQEARKAYTEFDDRELIDALRARGMTSEDMVGGSARLGLNVGGMKMDASDLADPTKRDRVLDYLAKEEPKESGNFFNRLSKVTESVGNVTDFARKDTLSQARQAKTVLEGVGKSGGLLGDGALAGVGGAATKAVPYIGAAVMAYEGVEKGAELYQGYKNTGLVQGGGAAEGFQIEAGIRTLAMNPFLSTEQARQIMMTGLQSGAKGKQLDMMTDFMATNLKDMNMSVGESMELLKTNVKQGGESIEDLGNQLDSVKRIASGGAGNLQDATKSFAETSKAMVSQGMTGEDAAKLAKQGVALFNEDGNKLKDQGGKMLQALGTNESLMAKVAANNGITDWADAPNIMGDKYGKAIYDDAVKAASLYNGQTKAFQGYLARYGYQMDYNQAKDLQRQLLTGDPWGDAQGRVKEANTIQMDKRGTGEQVTGLATGVTKGVGGMFKGVAGVLGGTLQAGAHSIFGLGDTDWGSVAETAQKDFGGGGNEINKAFVGASTTANMDPINNLVDRYGAGNVRIKKGDDEVSYLGFDWKDKNEVEKINSGAYKIVTEKDGKTNVNTLEELSNGVDQIEGAGNGRMEGRVYLELSDAAKQVVKVDSPYINLSRNELESNTAWKGATSNNPSPEPR